ANAANEPPNNSHTETLTGPLLARFGLRRGALRQIQMRSACLTPAYSLAGPWAQQVSDHRQREGDDDQGGHLRLFEATQDDDVVADKEDEELGDRGEHEVDHREHAFGEDPRP